MSGHLVWLAMSCFSCTPRPLLAPLPCFCCRCYAVLAENHTTHNPAAPCHHPSPPLPPPAFRLRFVLSCGGGMQQHSTAYRAAWQYSTHNSNNSNHPHHHPSAQLVHPNTNHHSQPPTVTTPTAKFPTTGRQLQIPLLLLLLGLGQAVRAFLQPPVRMCSPPETYSSCTSCCCSCYSSWREG